MTDQVLFTLILSLATLLCSLVAGFLLAFAIVVMPGIRKLNDRDFLRAFQVMDGMIQDNQPVFMVVWVGSIVASLVAAVLGIGHVDFRHPLFVASKMAVFHQSHGGGDDNFRGDLRGHFPRHSRGPYLAGVVAISDS